MKNLNVVWDFDGTLALSIDHHRHTAIQIADLLGIDVPEDDHLGLRTIRMDSRIESLGAYHDIASFHRIVTDLTIVSPKLCVNLLDFISTDSHRPHFVCSSSRRALVMRLLGEYTGIFSGIFGYEQGEKESILRGLSHRPTILVTDSVIDVKRADGADVVPIGVSWGADTSNALSTAGCLHVFDSESELINYLRRN